MLINTIATLDCYIIVCKNDKQKGSSYEDCKSLNGLLLKTILALINKANQDFYYQLASTFKTTYCSR